MKNSLCKIRDNELYSSISPLNWLYSYLSPKTVDCMVVFQWITGYIVVYPRTTGYIVVYSPANKSYHGNWLYSSMSPSTGYIVTFPPDSWLYGSISMDNWLYSCLSPRITDYIVVFPKTIIKLLLQSACTSVPSHI